MPEIIGRKDARTYRLKWYFTGIPCPQSHVSERSVRDRTCRECSRAKCRAYMAKRRASDPQGEREKTRESYYKHQETRKTKMRMYSFISTAALQTLRKIGIVESKQKVSHRRENEIKKRSREKRLLEDPTCRDRVNANARAYYWRNTEKCKERHCTRSKTAVAAALALKEAGIQI